MADPLKALARLLAAGLVCAGCEGADVAPPAADAGAAPALLTDRVWTRSDAGAPPGVLWIFLSNGTLVQDSCWETHRLSRWAADASGELRWQEDSAEIRATIAELTQQSLVLRLQLVGGVEEQRYVAATVPYLCPDMPR